ncbi:MULTISPECIES: VIT1/CCC1 transporter family protein [Acetobacter]|mgnify:CR=1 FL=1|jgi:VIT1/CCC1 family predicted Fe2+/Mn2+ transporter|uniref:VIT1/CCC1 family predicted Fe2+/Mn2+ transporter n=1 Tax=Acetobacter lovaniensis TaxID=104100 RepID=A0A841QDW3_9PROT|nr:VIT family protein [Acetobacter lovaniensis]MBB6456636.1 VIT1/CCC1 family predicted Fe2+/Mn2+ transporter [Acetobacter lovaniensis]MCP1239226.1 VIT family protein [Acetobacter lovaniensis]NHN82843.1 VIT family protein [Acetobacter lovaniensis]GBQ65334.1 nodulin-related integral membrane protein [Acetobacter lovaniensis NRIC 0474]
MHTESNIPAYTKENHVTSRLGWLRATVLGANDGILSTSSLIIGVASAHATQASILLAGISSLVAGAMSMAAGEYVSVSSQADSEKADLNREKKELSNSWDAEVNELASIYRQRGLDDALAHEVALQLMKHDALGSHARDELGIFEATAARPVQAAFASAGAFSSGAILPVLAALMSPANVVSWTVSAVSLISLAVLGIVGARAGGASPWRPAMRILFWGIVAMIVTAGIGKMFGVQA